MAGQASQEVRKLQASICELDRSLGWQGAAAEQRFDPLDVHGAVAWQPAGTRRAAPRPRGRPGSASPLLLGGGSPGSGSGGAMSPLSRRIMESSGAGGSFLERLERDIEQRQAARAVRQARAGRYTGGTAEQMAEREQERRDLSLVRWAVPCLACDQTLCPAPSFPAGCHAWSLCGLMNASNLHHRALLMCATVQGGGGGTQRGAG